MSRRSDWLPPWEDVAIAAALLVAVQLEVWVWWTEAEQGPRPLAATAAALMTVPLVWRRLHPVATLAALLTVYLAWILIAVPQGSLVPFLVELLAVFTLAQVSSTRPAVAGLVATVLLEVVFVWRTTNDFADYAFILAFVAGAWAAGRAVRVRQVRADALFERTVRLEVEREEQARAAAEAERARIARELHDIISHSVSVMVVQAGAAEQVMPTDPAAAAAALRAVQDVGREARLELRQMLGLLRADSGLSMLEPQPDLSRVNGLAETMAQAGVTVDLQTTGRPVSMPPGVGVSAYRIIQEALTNAVRHSGASQATVIIRYQPDEVELEITNPGAGQRPARQTNGFGLAGMRERVELYGGQLEAGTRADGSYCVQARLPVRRDLS